MDKYFWSRSYHVNWGVQTSEKAQFWANLVLKSNRKIQNRQNRQKPTVLTNIEYFKNFECRIWHDIILVTLAIRNTIAWVSINTVYWSLRNSNGLLGSILSILYFSWILALNYPQIESFENSSHPKWHDMTLITVVMGNTIEWYSLVEFEKFKWIIWVNIVYFAFSMDFGHKLSPNWGIWELWTPNMTRYWLGNA